MSGKYGVALASHIERQLKLKDPVEAIEGIVNSDFFPRVWNEDDFRNLPEMLRTVCDVYAFCINSGAAGLVGLFSDSSTRLAMNEIEASLKRIGAKRSCDFVEKLRVAMPRKRFPRNATESARVWNVLMSAPGKQGQSAAMFRKLMAEYVPAVSSLPEELRRFLKKNSKELIDALAAAKSGGGR